MCVCRRVWRGREEEEEERKGEEERKWEEEKEEKDDGCQFRVGDRIVCQTDLARVDSPPSPGARKAWHRVWWG